MKMMYTTAELRKLWEQYHSGIHKGLGTPCDACPGDPCYITAFLDWLDKRAAAKDAIKARIERNQ